MVYFKCVTCLIVSVISSLLVYGQNSGVNEKNHTFSITKATELDFDAAKELSMKYPKIDTTTIDIEKVDGELKLPLERKWKPYASFTDTLVDSDDTDIREFWYLGEFKEIGYYLVGGSFWEHFECYLINKKNGHSQTIWSVPSISPAEKYLANLSMQYGIEGVPNGIQIWRINRQEYDDSEPILIEKYLELDQQIWAPDDFVWETDNTLIIKVAEVEAYLNENGEPKQDDFYYLRLTL